MVFPLISVTADLKPSIKKKQPPCSKIVFPLISNTVTWSSVLLPPPLGEAVASLPLLRPLRVSAVFGISLQQLLMHYVLDAVANLQTAVKWNAYSGMSRGQISFFARVGALCVPSRIRMGSARNEPDIHGQRNQPKPPPKKKQTQKKK